MSLTRFAVRVLIIQAILMVYYMLLSFNGTYAKIDCRAEKMDCFPKPAPGIKSICELTCSSQVPAETQLSLHAYRFFFFWALTHIVEFLFKQINANFELF
ncbi:unnamed protein product [Caenorhabditis angaria]|uniref:Uncharacterized protein n=1 Tax=Caenorhabditis angaria TaxID=860376 RepID=A0A9P1IT68_9PELO|nr:unnamed protein product [Caenorhabditis angaria]